MNLIKCNGYNHSLFLNVSIVNRLTNNEREILEYALSEYNFINKEKHTAQYSITVHQWVENIKGFYDVNHLRTKAVLNVLSKFC